jgi:hypothetical protein
MPYTVRFPFQLTRSSSLGGLENPISHTAQGLTFKLARQGEWLILTVSDFGLENQAEEFVGRVWAGLAQVLLERSIAFEASTAIDKPVIAANPAEAAINLGFMDGQLVHGLVEGSIPSVFQTDLKIKAITMGAPSVLITTPASDFLSTLVNGALQPNSHQLPLHERLRTAMDLYSSYWYEASPKARFLTLVMALEALTTPRKKEKLVLDLLDKWKGEVDELRNKVHTGSDEDHALEAISRELLFREESSIRSRVRELVLGTLAPQGKDGAAADAKRALAAYDARSVLIHEGTIDPTVLAKASTDAREVLQKVLTAKVAALTG